MVNTITLKSRKLVNTMDSMKKFQEIIAPISEASVAQEAFVVIPNNMFVFIKERNGLFAMGQAFIFTTGNRLVKKLT